MSAMLPHVRQPIAGNASATPPWYAWFSDIQQLATSGAISGDAATAAIAAIARALGSPDGSVERIPPLPGNPTFAGNYSVQVNGANGTYTLQLRGDSPEPLPTAYYGTDSEGERGFFPIADAIATDESLGREVDAAGVTTLRLPDLPDTGGGTLQRFERDAKGRVAGTSDATTDDLPEGSANLYHTPERAAAAAPVQSVNGQTGHVVVSGGGGSVPTLIPAGDTFTVPANTQALFALPIEIEGALVIDGALVEVS